MNKYNFMCGGDWGAWESEVSVALSDEEVSRLKEYGKKDEFLDVGAGVDDIYEKVYEELLQQCDDEPNNVVIWVPWKLRSEV